MTSDMTPGMKSGDKPGDKPADIVVLSTPGCVGCEPTKQLIARVLDDFPLLDWAEIDVIDHPELAVKYQLMSAPAVVIGGELAFTGIPGESALRARLTNYTAIT